MVERGYNPATVFEVALKIKETSYVTADPYSSADFLHVLVRRMLAAAPPPVH